MARKPPKGKSFGEVNPEISKQWHPTKNGELTPFDVSFGSDKKVWWKCDKGSDHDWMATISHRSNNRGCSICAGKKVVKSTCLATTHPEITKKWHPAKNGELTPFDVSFGSDKKVWWKCPKGDDHEWEKKVNQIAQGLGCPICSGHKIVASNCLATSHPNIAKEWHPTKNGSVTPFDTTKGRTQRYWWKCSKGDDHEWFTSPNQRIKTGCPICDGKKVVKSNSLSSINIELAKEWHPTKNGELTPDDVISGSNKKAWWKCAKGDEHEWKTSINHRANGTGCPFCLNQKVSSTNCLSITHANISKEWHLTKNGELTPDDVISGSNKKAWWKCPKGDDHEWKSSINARTGSRKTGCPMCFGFKVVNSNSLLTTFPKISKELHPTKNKKISAARLYYSSNKKVWWKCSKGDDHEWRTSVRHRTHSKSNCPYCTLTPQSKQELIITFELMMLFKNIDPKGLKTRLDGRLRAIDIFIPKLNLCIEFDGSYWHKDKRDIDKIKSEMLFEEGFKLIRLREEPLKKIYDTDVISKQPYNGKQVINDTLSMIMYIFELDAKLVSKIKDYQSKDGLQNEKGLDKYIDKILTEKAEKK